MAKTYPVMKGAEAFHFPGNEVGILVQHGFTGTTQSMRGLGEYLAKCGFTVYGPRLKGHGTHYEEMEGTTWKDWIESADDGYRMLKRSVPRSLSSVCPWVGHWPWNWPIAIRRSGEWY